MKSLLHTFHPIQSARWLKVGRWCLASLYFTFFILHSSLTDGQTREQLTGTWIGVHTEMNVDFTCPLPTYMRLNADSTYQLGLVDGSATELKSSWSVKGEIVRLDTVHFAPRLLTIQGNELRIGTNYPLVFRRFTDLPIDSAETYRSLSGRVWQSDNLIISLYSNGQASLENTQTKQRTVHFWQLATFNQSVFLVIFGNQANRKGGYKPLWQITSVLPNQMQAIGWNGCAIASETFRLARPIAPGELCQPTGFQTCDNCFHPIWHEAHLTHTSKQYELNQLLTKYYQPVTSKGQSGLLTIAFTVNCMGQHDLLVVKGLGDDYCPKTFDSQLTDQLLSICSNHIANNSFLYPSQDPAQQTNDTAVSLTFRLIDGHITDILP